ncbi:hypothetical protein T484DRAFT_1828083, partial [Baffinella frigidus]
GTERFICPLTVSADFPSESLLRHQEPLFFRALGVEELDEVALLERFMLPKFGTLLPARRQEVADQILRNWPAIEQRPVMLDKLKALPLVDMYGSLVRADQLFDPKTPLLAAGDPVFPVGAFASDPWLVILRKLGLQSSLDADTFIQCARRVQRSFAQAK